MQPTSQQTVQNAGSLSRTNSSNSIRFFKERHGFRVGYTTLGQRIAAIYQISNGAITYLWEPSEETQNS